MPTNVIRNDTYIFYVDNANCSPGGSVTFWTSENIPGATLDEDTYIEFLTEWIDSTRYTPATGDLNSELLMGISTDSSSAHLMLGAIIAPTCILFIMYQLGLLKRFSKQAAVNSGEYSN